MSLYRIDPNAGLRNQVTTLALQEEGRKLNLDNRSRAYIVARKKLKPQTLDEDNQLRAYYGLDPVELGGGGTTKRVFNQRGQAFFVPDTKRRTVDRNPLKPHDISMANPTLDLINSEAARDKTIQSEQALAGDLGVNMPKTVQFDGTNVRLQPRSELGIGVRRQLIRRDTPYTNSNGKSVSGAIRPSNVDGQAPITQPERVFALANLDQQRRTLKAQSKEHKATVNKLKALVAVVGRETRNLGDNRIDTIPEWMAVAHKVYPNLDLYDPAVQKIFQSATTPNGVDTTSAGYGGKIESQAATAAGLEPTGITSRGITYGRPRATTPGRLTDTQRVMATLKNKAAAYRIRLSGNSLPELRKNYIDQLTQLGASQKANAKAATQEAAWEKAKFLIDEGGWGSKNDVLNNIRTNVGKLIAAGVDVQKLYTRVKNYKR